MVDQPPKAARWLLTHFGCGPNNDTVIGDLDERYRAGRSRMWYWQQTLRAIVTSFCQEVWSHKLLAAYALFLAWAIKYAWLWLAAYANRLWLESYAYRTGCSPLNVCGRILMGSPWHLPLLVASVTGSVVVCAFSAWFVSRISGIHYRSMVLLYVLIELLAVPVRLIGPGGDIPAMIVGAPGEFIPLWASPFATYFNLGLGKLGYPFETVIALWCGCIAMAATMLLAGGILREPSVTRLPRSAA
jgi:hypothetical protein